MFPRPRTGWSLESRKENRGIILALRVRSIERWQLTLRYIFSVNTKDYRVGQREVYSCHMENNTIII